MNKLITTATGGMPFNLDDLRWILGQDSSTAGIYQVLNKMLLSLGTDYIVAGCELSGSTISEGLIMLDSELIWVAEHDILSTHFVKVTSYDATGFKTYQDGSTNDTYQKVRATVTASSGSLAFADAPTYKSLTKAFNSYYAENYDSGALDPSVVPTGELWLGKGNRLKLTSVGTTISGNASVQGNVTSDAGDLVSSTGDVISTTGNVNAGDKFVGDNAAKIVLLVESAGTITTNKGVYTPTVTRPTTGTYNISNANIPDDAIVIATATSGGEIANASVSAGIIYVYVYTNTTAFLVNSDFSVVAYW